MLLRDLEVGSKFALGKGSNTTAQIKVTFGISFTVQGSGKQVRYKQVH